MLYDFYSLLWVFFKFSIQKGSKVFLHKSALFNGHRGILRDNAITLGGEAGAKLLGAAR